jgi:hypothetical protein
MRPEYKTGRFYTERAKEDTAEGREYWFDGPKENARLFMASDAVVHQIDGVLFYGYTYPDDYADATKAGKTVKMRPWREIVEEALNK